MNPNPPVTDPEAHDSLLAQRSKDPSKGRKHGMNQVTANTGELQLNTHSLKDVASTVAVWGGLLLFGLSAFVWLAVLSRASLSFAYPFASLTYV